MLPRQRLMTLTAAADAWRLIAFVSYAERVDVTSLPGAIAGFSATPSPLRCLISRRYAGASFEYFSCCRRFDA